MAQLIPCPGCSRHVRAGALECPFCASGLEDEQRAVRSRAPTARLGRAATFAFGAAVATSIQVAGCGDSHDGAVDASTGTDAASATDAGGEATDAGEEATDAGVEEDDGGGVGPLYGGSPVPVDAGPGEEDAGGPAPPYGAPPESE